MMLSKDESSLKKTVTEELLAANKEKDLKNLAQLIEVIRHYLNEFKSYDLDLQKKASLLKAALSTIGKLSIDMQQLVSSVRVLHKDIPWNDLDSLVEFVNFDATVDKDDSEFKVKKYIHYLAFQTQNGQASLINGLEELDTRLGTIYNSHIKKTSVALNNANPIVPLVTKNVSTSVIIPEYNGLVSVRKFTELFRDVVNLQALCADFSVVSDFSYENFDKKVAGLLLEIGEKVHSFSVILCRQLKNTPYKPLFESDDDFSLMEVLSSYYQARNTVRHAALSINNLLDLREILNDIEKISVRFQYDSDQVNTFYSEFFAEVLQLLAEHSHDQAICRLEERIHVNSPQSIKEKAIKNKKIKEDHLQAINQNLRGNLNLGYEVSLPVESKEEISIIDYTQYFDDLLSNKVGFSQQDITTSSQSKKIINNILNLYQLVPNVEDKVVSRANRYFIKHLINLFKLVPVDREKNALKKVADDLYQEVDANKKVDVEAFRKIFVGFLRNGFSMKPDHLQLLCRLTEVVYDQKKFELIVKEGIDEKSEDIQEKFAQFFFYKENEKVLTESNISEKFNQHFVIKPVKINKKAMDTIGLALFNIQVVPNLADYKETSKKFTNCFSLFLSQGFQEDESLEYLFKISGLDYVKHLPLIRQINDSGIESLNEDELSLLANVKSHFEKTFLLSDPDQTLALLKARKKEKKIPQNLLGYYVSAKIMFDDKFGIDKPVVANDKSVSKPKKEKAPKIEIDNGKNDIILFIGKLLDRVIDVKVKQFDNPYALNIDRLESVVNILRHTRKILKSSKDFELARESKSWSHVFTIIIDPNKRFQIIFLLAFISELVAVVKNNLFDNVIKTLPDVTDQEREEMIACLMTLRVDGNSLAHHTYDREISIIKPLLDDSLYMLFESNLLLLVKGLYMQRHVKEVKTILHNLLEIAEHFDEASDIKKDSLASLNRRIVNDIANPLFYKNGHFNAGLCMLHSSIFSKPNKHDVFIRRRPKDVKDDNTKKVPQNQDEIKEGKQEEPEEKKENKFSS